MNYLDIIIGIILLLFALAGLKNGIIREAFALVAFIGGVYGAARLSDYAGEKLSTIINVSHEWMSIISFIIVFIILALAINLIGKGVSKLVESLHLGFFDKIGGFVFGVAKGLLIVSVIIIILDFFGIKDVLNKETREKSVLYTTSENIAEWITDNKDSFIKEFDNKVDDAEDEIKDLI
ncbi:MAG: CvpA family protein [Bacteroidales bacterium]|nr:CvpA family protein [Bacteroidales bacterium]